MSVDLTAIRQGIADKCAAVSGIRSATISVDLVTATPAVVVSHIADFGLDDTRGGRYFVNDAWQYSINADLLVAPTSTYGRAMVTTDGLITGIKEEFWTGYGLGITEIADLWLQGGPTAQLQYGDVEYVGAKLLFIVQTWEPVVGRSRT